MRGKVIERASDRLVSRGDSGLTVLGEGNRLCGIFAGSHEQGAIKPADIDEVHSWLRPYYEAYFSRFQFERMMDLFEPRKTGQACSGDTLRTWLEGFLQD